MLLYSHLIILVVGYVTSTTLRNQENTVQCPPECSSSQSDRNQVQCPPGCLGDGSTKKFYIREEKVSFLGAFVNCKRNGSDLATIRDKKESDALDKFLDPYKIDGWENGFWLSGVRIEKSNSQYYWLATGERIILDNWHPHEPNNYDDDEYCMQWAYMRNRTGWNDWFCKRGLRYVCELIED